MAIKTLTELINFKTEFNIRNVSIFATNDDIIYIDYTMYNKYRNLLKKYVRVYDLEAADASRYTYKPALLSRDMYGTPELDTLILMINDCESPSDFLLRKTIKMIDQNDIKTFFDTIILQNQEILEKNKMEVGLL